MLKLTKSDRAKIARVSKMLEKHYGTTEDPWGLTISKAKRSLELIYPFYKYYFNTRVHGTENIKDKQYMIVSNHSGQIAIDGLLIGAAFAMETEEPRILRAMVERFFTNLPFINKWASECGAVLGDRENCQNLLDRGESLLVFPEGVRGVAKSTPDYYQLQEFTRGFYRMALKSNVEIIPVAVIGAEETFPYVYQAKWLAKSLGLPALPISANYLPLPSPIDIYIGKPISVSPELSSQNTDHDIDPFIEDIEITIQGMIDEGLQNKRELPLSKFFKGLKK